MEVHNGQRLSLEHNPWRLLRQLGGLRLHIHLGTGRTYFGSSILYNFGLWGGTHGLEPDHLCLSNVLVGVFLCIHVHAPAKKASIDHVEGDSRPFGIERCPNLTLISGIVASLSGRKPSEVFALQRTLMKFL